MFCSKCGTEITEGADFCQKCGAKVYHEKKTSQQLGAAIATDEILSDTTDMAQANQEDNKSQVTNNNLDEFKKFVDDHVQKNTKFQTAAELLDSRVQLRFVWICCVGFPLVLALINIALGLFALLIGYLTAYLIGAVKKHKYVRELSGKTEGNIDMDELISFLNKYLGHAFPYFHEWGYLQKSGLSVQAIVQTSIEEQVSKTLKETRLCTELGEHGRRLSVICIRPSLANPDSGQLDYLLYAVNRIEGMSLISHDWGFAKYRCMLKTCPILQAAMEYYLNIYK